VGDVRFRQKWPGLSRAHKLQNSNQKPCLNFFLSFFLSFVPKTQPNHLNFRKKSWNFCPIWKKWLTTTKPNFRTLIKQSNTRFDPYHTESSHWRKPWLSPNFEDSDSMIRAAVQSQLGRPASWRTRASSDFLWFCLSFYTFICVLHGYTPRVLFWAQSGGRSKIFRILYQKTNKHTITRGGTETSSLKSISSLRPRDRVPNGEIPRY